MKKETKNLCVYATLMACCFSILVNGAMIAPNQAEAAADLKANLKIEADYPFYLDIGDACALNVSQDASVEQEIRVMARCHGVDEAKAVAIAKCESSLNPTAVNQQGSTAKGVFMFTDPTWKYIGAKGHQFDRHENVAQFMKWYPLHPDWWACNKLI